MLSAQGSPVSYCAASSEWPPWINKGSLLLQLPTSIIFVFISHYSQTMERNKKVLFAYMSSTTTQSQPLLLNNNFMFAQRENVCFYNPSSFYNLWCVHYRPGVLRRKSLNAGSKMTPITERKISHDSSCHKKTCWQHCEHTADSAASLAILTLVPEIRRVYFFANTHFKRQICIVYKLIELTKSDFSKEKNW